MDFVTGLPRTPKGNDAIWVIVDRLTKTAHFIPVKTTYKGAKLAQLYIKNVVRLHGIPSRIVSDRGTQFTSKFWESLHKALGTSLDFSSAYHPQTDGQTERVNQVMEDLLRACVLTYGKDWESSLPYAEFSYNNGYQASLGMAGPVGAGSLSSAKISGVLHFLPYNASKEAIPRLAWYPLL